MPETLRVVMMGASGAVGSAALARLIALPQITSVTVLDRREVERPAIEKVTAHVVELDDPETYQEKLAGHDAAICTFGVGDPSKVEDDEFVRIDKTMPLTFARACKRAGIAHFEMLTSIAANAGSKNLYVRSKGELEAGLAALDFKRLSVFKPAMILTPERRYGTAAEAALAIWPYLSGVLHGRLRKLRGIKVDALGSAFAENLLTSDSGVDGVENLFWDDFRRLTVGKRS